MAVSTVFVNSTDIVLLDEDEDREIDGKENVSKNEDGFLENDRHLIASVLTSRMLLCKRI
ncbi:hypothetical protein WN943_003283 [Citrus x changshan-huyou]